MRLSSLPSFRSLVVHGPYPPAAPVHLSLSVPTPDHAIFFTPSRDSLLQALKDDPWLIKQSGTGSVASMSSRVTIFYPLNPQRLVAILGMLRTHNASPSPVPVVTLDRTPSLIVMHELSAYFLPEQGEYTISSYLLLITHALSTIEFLCTHGSKPPPASLVIFDSRLDHLKLPVLRTPPKSILDEHDDSEDGPRPESVLFFVEKYFELSATFQSQTDSESPVLALRRIGQDGVENFDL